MVFIKIKNKENSYIFKISYDFFLIKFEMTQDQFNIIKFYILNENIGSVNILNSNSNFFVFKFYYDQIDIEINNLKDISEYKTILSRKNFIDAINF